MKSSVFIKRAARILVSAHRAARPWDILAALAVGAFCLAYALRDAEEQAPKHALAIATAPVARTSHSLPATSAESSGSQVAENTPWRPTVQPPDQPAAPAQPSNAPFWESAVVPDPAFPSPPLPARPPPPKQFPTAAENASAVARLDAMERTPENLRELNETLGNWFRQTPEAAVAWINAQPDIRHLADAVGSIAVSLSLEGDFESAFANLDAISHSNQWRNALIDIYRASPVKPPREELRAAEIPEEVIDAIFASD